MPLDPQIEIKERWDRYRLKANVAGELSYDSIATWWLQEITKATEERVRMVREEIDSIPPATALQGIDIFKITAKDMKNAILILPSLQLPTPIKQDHDNN